MTTVRSLIFTLWLYLSMPLFAIGLSPALLMRRYWTTACPGCPLRNRCTTNTLRRFCNDRLAAFRKLHRYH